MDNIKLTSAGFATPAAGTRFSGDNVDGVLYPRVKIDIGGDDINSIIRPGIKINGGQDEVVLCVQNLAAGVENYFAIVDWREPL